MKKYLLSLVGALPVFAVAWSTVQAAPKPEPWDNGVDCSAAWRNASAVADVLPPGSIRETTGFEVPDFDSSAPGALQICGATYDDGDCTALPSGCKAPGSPPAATENCCADWPNPLNGWFVSGASLSCKEPHVSTLHPAGGTQHMRFQADASSNTFHRAFSPYNGVGVNGPSTISFDISATATGGSDLLFAVLSNQSGFLMYMYFSNSVDNPGVGYITVRPALQANPGFATACWADNTDFCGHGIVPVNTYHHVEIQSQPCRGTAKVDYYWDGVLVYSHASNLMPAIDFDRFTFQGFANSGTAMWDIDNMSITRGSVCPVICGDGFIDAPEKCEAGVSPGCNPGHTCNAPGTPNECQCSRICTLNDPCVLQKGPNGPYAGPFDAAYGGIFLFEADNDAESVSINACGSNYDSKIYYWGSANDPNDFGATNDDCCDPTNPDCGAAYGAGSDPSASCYVPGDNGPYYPACTCWDLPAPADTLYLAQTNTPSGSKNLSINVTNKTACGQPILGGACCDGTTGLCSQVASAAACAGDQQVYSNNKTCDMVQCVRHTGACCDNNPKAAHCTDGTYPEDCAGANQTWIKGGVCGTAQCPALTLGACCDTLRGNCADNKVAAECAGVQDVFTLDGTCANVTCAADLGACCDTDPFGGCSNTTLAQCEGDVKFVWTKGGTCANTTCVHNAIPTVSTWGLAILTLLLLTGAKVYFGRRQASAA